MNIWALIIGFFKSLMHISDVPQTPSTSSKLPPASSHPTADDIYDAAVRNLGKMLALDKSVPKEVRCAQAVSYVLRSAGFPIPSAGISTVNGIVDWLIDNHFEEVTSAVPGAVIVAHNKNRDIPDNAHAGICLKYGVASNTSYDVAGFESGHFGENYSFGGWTRAFDDKGSISRYFVPNL